LFAIAGELGLHDDRDVANLAGVSVETVTNWRAGAVQEVKPQKLAAIKKGLGTRIATLRDAGGTRLGDDSLVPVEVERGSGPSDLQRQFRERILYDYLGHRFLYYDPQGALAWEMLIGTGYEQDRWLRGIERCAQRWLDVAKDERGREQGVLARAVGLSRPGHGQGLDVVSLGPGEGGKEIRLLEHLLDAEGRARQRLPWLTMCFVDVSIPLLLKATRATHEALRGHEGADHVAVVPVCADFEDGPLSFGRRLQSHGEEAAEGVRLVLLLGNNFGNLRDEESFIRQKLWRLVRPGDYVWLEVGIRPERPQDDPLFRLTLEDHEETAADACRRLLMQGPYRRWEAALGRAPSTLDMRVWLREDDDSARVPGSYNFCHDLIIKEEARSCSIFYSRRYDMEPLVRWLREHELEVEDIEEVEDARRRPRVAHLLARRR
jgi:transcriptional regulator with XRE-family HTH domain